jgi:hypothetical protein
VPEVAITAANPPSGSAAFRSFESVLLAEDVSFPSRFSSNIPPLMPIQNMTRLSDRPDVRPLQIRYQ